MKPDWSAIQREWRERKAPLDPEALLKLRMEANPETSHACSVAQETIRMVLRWLERAYPSGNYPPVGVPQVFASCLSRYGKKAYARHGELEQLEIPWSEFLSAQSDINISGKAPDLWTVFNDTGLGRFNRYMEQVELVDGRRIQRLSAGAVRGMRHQDRWQELVGKWENGRQVLTSALTSCPGLSPEAAILLECHMIDGAFLIADRDGIAAIDSGTLPEPKIAGALQLLEELEKDKYTSRRFYDAVIERGAVL